MPRSQVSKKKLFREFSKQDKLYVKRNYLKNLKTIKEKYVQSTGLDFTKIEFLIWAYDLQFFTLDYMSKNFGVSKSNVSKRYISPLTKGEYLYKHFDRLTPSATYEDHLFRDETKHNYRVRYAITQKARLLVQRVYRDLEN
tara:strand:+ start:1641 stop:2063 length:423 start_codon:yes stop_codon:yes gene_type:complete